MQTKTEDKKMRDYRRQMLRGEFRSLFWAIFSDRKRRERFTLQAFAGKLGIGKSSLSRGFNEPQNWTIDKIADMADALGVDLILEARDNQSGVIYTPIGQSNYAQTGTTTSQRCIAPIEIISCARPIPISAVSGTISLGSKFEIARAA